MSWNRRIKLFLLAGAMLFLCAFFLYAMPRHSFLKCLVSTLQFEEILKTRQEQAKNPVHGMTFNDTPLFYDKETNIYYFSIDTNFRAANPSISISGGNRISLAILGTEINRESVEKNTLYPMIFYTEDTYFQANLAVTSLPVISINTQEIPPDSHTPISFEETALEMTVYDNRPEATHNERLHILQATAHIRGASSLFYPKKAYRIQLLNESMGLNIRKNPTSLLGMTGDDDWILYAPYNDPEKIRNTFCTNLWQQWAGNRNPWKMDITTEGRLVELFINGRYWGLYTLMRPVTAEKLGLQEDSDLQNTDYLYRSISYEETTPETFQSAISDTIAGGYELRFPKTEIHDSRKWAPMENLHNLIYGYDTDIEYKLFDILYMENVIDYYLFINIITAVDNVGKNQIYIARNTGNGYRILVMPWDFDQTFGMDWNPENNPLQTSMLITPQFHLQGSNGLSKFIEMDIDGTTGKIKERYAQLREGLLSEASITAQLAAYEAEVFGSGAALRNRERWPEAAYAENMDTLREWILARLETMDGLIHTLGEA